MFGSCSPFYLIMIGVQTEISHEFVILIFSNTLSFLLLFFNDYNINYHHYIIITIIVVIIIIIIIIIIVIIIISSVAAKGKPGSWNLYVQL